MNAALEPDSLRIKQANDAVKRLMAADPPPDPESIHEAALECFEAGAPAEAGKLLSHFAGHEILAPTITKTAWFIRFQSWLDAAKAEDLLAEKPQFTAEDTSVILSLAKRLRNASQFGLSRRLLARLAGEREDLLAEPAADAEAQTTFAVLLLEKYTKAIQDLSLSTYKDLDLHPARSLAEAERLLGKVGLREETCADPETLGQGGAVFKRRWELTGRLEHLQQSLAFYRRGWEARKSDNTRWDEDAYCGGNAAFVLDLLAQRIDGLDAEQASTWRNEAKTIRETYVAELESRTRESKWYFASLADGHFALGNYAQAGEYYSAASQAMEGDWERKTMFLQAVQLAGARGIPLAEPKVLAAIQPILGERTAAALAGFRPKTGLALSGGGFRAAFYHLGVLARLADIDALRHIETISTVSGGSIVGTHYFLKLKTLIEEKGDAITAEDYRQLVHELIGEFRAGVATNLRMRAFISLRALWRMLFRLNYNRTLRMGELYDATFYARILGKTATTLRDLIVSPKGETRAFSPRQDNWLRRAKVPILLINATNLNSGHSWQFAGSFMGEPPGLLEAEIDANERYARIHLDSRGVLRKWREFPLGSAVAASSAVPGLFNPVPLSGLYAERDVQLADGGVYDNQGVDTLLQENCSLILCSDASGQLSDDRSPATLSFGVLARANNISMERDRIVEYQDLRSRLENGALDGLLFVHLRQGLDIRRVPPISDKPATAQSGVEASSRTDYCVDKGIQRLLSQIRTDLDSFTEVEADALMLSGYQAAGKQIEECQKKLPPGERWGGFDTSAYGNDDWPFLGIAAYICATPGQQDATTSARVFDVKNQLDASSNLFAKFFFLNVDFFAKALIAVPIIAAAGFAAAALVWCFAIVGDWLISRVCFWELVAWLMGGGLVIALILKFAQKSRLRRIIQRLGELALAILVLPIAVAGLWFFNRLYLKHGSRERLERIE